ncbi:unnamed protein product [Schistosoma mattheei]|uniref:Uncharacterized protein n=1 Tax=Schistosoma mattheei TaxID=31246 RepID=A0A183PI77_9TREM|nr:unnamed protein product [Schistosoma mattheei]
MVVGGSQQETLDPSFVLLGTRQQDVPLILKELVLPDGFDPVPSCFKVRDVTTGISGPRLTSCRTETDHHPLSINCDQLNLVTN